MRLPYCLFIALILAVGCMSALLTRFPSGLLAPTPSQSPTHPPATNPPLAAIVDPIAKPPRSKPWLTREQRLQEVVDQFVATQPAEFYIYVKDLKSNDSAIHQADTALPSGSIYKLFLADQVYRLNAADELSMDAPAGNSGYSIAGCTMQMVQNSLNACGEAIRELLGAASTTKALRKQGYTHTDLRKDPAAETAAADVGLLLERLHEGKYYTAPQTSEFLGYLKNQRFRFRLPEGLPREPAIKGLIGTRNKTGDVFGYTNDAAIILGEKTDYIIVSMSGPWEAPENSSNAHRHLSGLIYNFLNGTDYKLLY